MSGKHVFQYFGEQIIFLLLDYVISIFLFSVAPSKMSTSGKVHFSSFRTSGKSGFSESAHFRRWDRKCILRKCFSFSFTRAIPVLNFPIPLYRKYILRNGFHFLFSVGPSKMTTSGKVHFSSFRTSGKSDFSGSAHFRCWHWKCILRKCFPFSFTRAVLFLNFPKPFWKVLGN